MKTVILLMALVVGSAHAQVVYQSQQYQEPRLRNVVPNPFPPSYYQQKMQQYNFRQSPRVIIVTPQQTVIPTGQVSPQDQQIINLIK